MIPALGCFEDWGIKSKPLTKRQKREQRGLAEAIGKGAAAKAERMAREVMRKCKGKRGKDG